MNKYKFSILDGIWDKCIADVELELSDDLLSKLRTWIEENHANESSFDIGELLEVDESFMNELEDAAFEYAKAAAIADGLEEISEDQDHGPHMFLNAVRSGEFVPKNWKSNRPFTVRDAFKRDEYFEEWESEQPKLGDPDYLDYLYERYDDIDSMIEYDMISYSVVFPDELYKKTVIYSVF